MAILNYRPEIDGLRAIAVIPVILFHAGFAPFAGGFIGVDVFFVISGYLITSIILTDLQRGTFSLIDFYARRARRILPALMLVVICCLPFAWAWMLPDQLRDFSQSVAAVALFASNILFWNENGYFAAAAETKPLLHTWSLAVEEQFYILFPVALLALWRGGWRWVIGGLAACLLIGFAAGEWASRAMPSAAFYLLPFRAFELLAGALLAVWLARNPIVPRDWLGAAGLALILASIFWVDGATRWPSPATLMPVLGTVLVILFAAGTSLTARLLSTPPMLAIGLISYSAYLWHQPAFAFARIRSIGEPDTLLMLGLSIGCFVPAYFSWRYVELPFRQRRVLPDLPALFAVAGALSVVMVVIGTFGYLQRGFPERFPVSVLATLNVPRGDKNACYSELTAARIEQGDICRFGDPQAAPSIAVIGDSHAARLIDSLDEHLRKAARAGATVNAGWCAPLMAFGTENPRKNPACRGLMQAAFARVLDDANIETVILFAEWANYTTGHRHNDRHVAAYSFGDQANDDPGANPEIFERALLHTVQSLSAAGKRIIILGSAPEYHLSVPEALATAEQRNLSPDRLALEISEFRARNSDVEEGLNRLESESVARVIRLAPLFCDTRACRPVDDQGLPLYSDGNHLNRRGADRVIRAILGEIIR